MGIFAIYLGAVIGGIGNGTSTYLMWETLTDSRIAELEKQVKLLGGKIAFVELKKGLKLSPS